MFRYSSSITGVLISSILLLAIACRKEYSYEGGRVPLVAAGSLSDSSGNCGGVTINGSYKTNVALTDNNYITVQANISSAGSYTIYTDTVNGYYFNATGYAGATGFQSVKLRGYGTPLVATAAGFTLHFNDGSCMFTIAPDSATLNLSGNCNATHVNGIYIEGMPLDAGDTVNILVNVTKPGSYSIKTPSLNGISFAATGTFAVAGNYPVTLTGSGTPVSAGNTTIPVTIAGTSCSFVVSVTSDTTNRQMFWRYTADGVDEQGILDSGIVSTSVNMLYPLNTIHTMQVYGAADGPFVAPITFQLYISRINHALITGSYHPAIDGSTDFIGFVLHFDSTGNLSASATLPDFTMFVTTYNDTTRLVEGNFIGPVIDEFGHSHTITKGAFRTYFKK
jgi:hypothetical protein